MIDSIAKRQRIRALSMRGVFVPLKFTLGTSAAIVRDVPLLLVDITNEDGLTGRAYAFCYRASGARAVAEHVQEAVALLKDKDISPFEARSILEKQFALLGVTGTVRMALSLIDMALWDMMAQAAGVPLASLLGSSPRPLAAYDSRGLGLMRPDQLKREAAALLELGLEAVKLRLGYPSLAEDVQALEAVRSSVPGHIAIMVDYNQALSPAQAIERGRVLEQHGIYWLEEPITHDAYAANAKIAGNLRVPLQIGENFNGPEALLRSVVAGASDFIMPDVARIGGVSGWMQAAAIVASHGIEMSTHLMPEISAQLLCATPTAHWLEYVDWADDILINPLRIADGKVMTSREAGSGIVWDEGKLSKLQSV